MTDQTPRPAGLDDLLNYVEENLPQDDADRCAQTLAGMSVAGVGILGSEKYPSQITVSCDHCGTEATNDYMVNEQMTRDERLRAARAHLVANEGWEHTTDGDDFCPAHASTVTA